MPPVPKEIPTTTAPPFVAITVARRYNSPIPYLYALDEAGKVWKYVQEHRPDPEYRHTRTLPAWVRVTDTAEVPSG